MPIIGWMCVECGDWLDSDGEHVNGSCDSDDITDDVSSGLPADDSGYGG